MEIRKLNITFVLVYFSLLSCTKNNDYYGPITYENVQPVAEAERIIVLNEGNFMFGNGSVSVIDNKNNTVANRVFKSQNGYPLGDVPQSMLVLDSIGYIVVNNSGKIEVVNLTDFKSIKTITGFNSPRYMTIVSEQPLIAWVTDLYANKIWYVDLKQGVIIGSSELDGWCEKITAQGFNVYVLNKTDSVICQLDMVSGKVNRVVSVDSGIIDIERWGEKHLAILTRFGVYRLDMTLMNMDTIIRFDTPRLPSKIAVNSEGDEVFFLEGNVYRILANNLTPSVEVFVDNVSGLNIYGMSYYSKRNELYLTDAKDYVQAGEVMVYSSKGIKITSFLVGVNPQFMVFE